MKFDKSVTLILLSFSIFCGVFIISLGLGSEFTAVNKVMSPFICGADTLQAAWEYNESGAGPTIYDSRWVCVDEAAGAARDASLKTNLIAGLIYGFLLFVGLMGWLWWANRTPPPNPTI